MKLLLCLLFIGYVNYTCHAQVQLTPQSIIKDSTGKIYTLMEAFELLKTKLYRIEKAGSASEEFILRKGAPVIQRSSASMEFDGMGPIKDMKDKAAPAFSATTYDGKKVELGKLKDKIIVLNFWFTECKPCIKEMPELNQLIEGYKKNENVIFLAPTFNSSSEIQKFLKTTPFNYQIIPGQTKHMIADYTISGYPSHVIIDYTGMVRFATQGYMEGDSAMQKVLKFKIDKLLEEKSNSAEIKKIAGALRSAILQKDFNIVKEYIFPYFPIKQPGGEMVAGTFVQDVLSEYFKNKLNLSEIKLASFNYTETGYKINFSSVDNSGKPGTFYALLTPDNKISELSFLKDQVLPFKVDKAPSSKTNISNAGAAKKVAELPFVFKNNQVVIKLKLNQSGEWVEFVFDTGSSIPLLTTTAREKLSLPVRESSQQIQGGGGNVTSLRSDNNRIILNDSVWLDEVSLAVTDMSGVTGFLYEGIIGADLMRNFIVKIDFEKQRIELFSSGNFSAPVGWQTLPIIRMIGNIPVVQTSLEINNKIKNLQLLFDCGAAPFTLFLNKNNFTEYQSSLASKTYNEGMNSGLAGPMKVWTYQKDATWNGKPWKDLPIGFDVEASTPLLESVDGILGMELIKRYNIIFNYAKNEIYLQPNNLTDGPFPVSYSGLQLMKKDQKILVRHVSPNSPGAIAGINAGDEIISIDGHMATDTEQVRSLLQQHGKKVKINVKRNGGSLTFTLPLQRFY